MEKYKEQDQNNFTRRISLSLDNCRTAENIFEKSETKNVPICEIDMKNAKKIFVGHSIFFSSQHQSKYEILLQNECEDKTRRSGVQYCVLFVIGIIITCITLILINEGGQNVLELKKFYEKKPLLHANENEDNLESIHKQLEFLKTTRDKEQEEHEKKLDALKKTLELISIMTEKEQKEKGDRWKIDHDQELELVKKKLQDLSKRNDKEPNCQKQAILCPIENEHKEKEQNEKKEKEKPKKHKVIEEQWDKNSLICQNEKNLVYRCLEQKHKEEADLQKQKENERNALIQLQSTIKTINEDHEKHFKYLAYLLNLKSFDQLKTTLRLLFRASEHEWLLADKFHQLCDGKGPTITIIRSEYKKIFGGYASRSWHTNGWSSAPDSYLFSLNYQSKHLINRNLDLAIRGDAEYGPSFGGSDIVLSYKRSDLFDPTHPNWSDLGFTYSLPFDVSFDSDAAHSYLAGSYHFKVEEYEVFGLNIENNGLRHYLFSFILLVSFIF